MRSLSRSVRGVTPSSYGAPQRKPLDGSLALQVCGAHGRRSSPPSEPDLRALGIRLPATRCEICVIYLWLEGEGPLRALVTGVAGFAGSHLADLLISEGVDVYGLVMPGGSLENLHEIRGDPLSAERLRLVEADIVDGKSLVEIVKEIRPDQVYHLAAASSVRRSLEDPGETLRVNVLGSRNLLDAIRRAAIRPRILLVSSAEAYGESAQLPRPLQEDDPLLPVSPYGASKAAAESIAHRYVAVFDLDIVLVRPFPHTGPRHAPHFVISDFARQVAEIEAGMREPVIRAGSLDVRRDITDVRDMVRAYWLAVLHGERGSTYNVCSGTVYSLRDVVTSLGSQASVPFGVTIEPARLRSRDLMILAGSNRRFRERTGWTPRIPLTQTLTDLVAYWRARVNPPIGGNSPDLARDRRVARVREDPDVPRVSRVSPPSSGTPITPGDERTGGRVPPPSRNGKAG